MRCQSELELTTMYHSQLIGDLIKTSVRTKKSSTLEVVGTKYIVFTNAWTEWRRACASAGS